MNIRKFTTYLLTLPMLSAALSAMAQPTVPGSAFPTAGTIFTLTLADTTGVTPGAGGANTSWNFGSLTPNGSTQVDSFLAPSATPYGGLFPASTIAVHEKNPATNYFIYYKDDGTGFFQRIANVQPDTVAYTDLPNEYPYPLTYNNTYTDTYHATNQHNNITHGDLTATVDGYGSLTTPTGTYTNAIRMHASRVEHDTIHAGPSVVPVLADFEYYVWYQPDAYFPIFTITTTTITSSVINRYSKAVGYRVGYQSPSGVNDLQSDKNNILIYPNPTAQQATLMYDAAGTESVLSIYDMTGRRMLSNTLPSSSGIQTYTLDVSALATGVYTVRVVNALGASDTKLQIAR